MESFIVTKESKVSECLQDKISGLTFQHVKMLLRKKDIKVNGKRINQDIVVHSQDRIEVYLPKAKVEDIVYNDDNILVANKRAGVEVCDGEDNLQKRLQKQENIKLFAVHRIDRNTTGLVIFAKNIAAKKELDKMFKEHTIKKFYLALVVGKIPQKQQKLIAYLKKDKDKSLVYISGEQKLGYDKIITNYKVLEERDNTSLLEVEIETGKTHQIRAHMAYIGHPVVGDDKYGSKEQNNTFKKHKQMLTAYRIVFAKPTGVLAYLKGKEIKISAWF